MSDMRRTHGLDTIGQVAESVGVATSTLRYYEREGLLAPADRSPSGYRLYDRHCVEQLRFIRSAQSVGFSLDDIKALLALDERTSCGQVQGMIEERLESIAGRIEELANIQRTLKRALGRCRKSRRGCPVLEDLRSKNRPTGRSRRKR